MPNGRATQAADLASGIETVRRLEEVAPQNAEGALAEVYEDIQQTLRIPFVNALFRVLAAGPPFLIPAWRAISPIVATVEFEKRADDLRETAAERVGKIPRQLMLELPDTEDAKVRDHLDSYHYALPKLALVAELLDRVAREDEGGHTEVGTNKIPQGPAKGTRSVALKGPGTAEGAVQRTYKEIQRSHDHPLVASFYQGLANWPLVLQTAWGTISPIVGTDEYLDVRDALQKKAYDLAADLHLEGVPLEGQRDADMQEVRDLLAVFRMRLIPDTLQDIVRIKASLDGEGGARWSRFSAVRPNPDQPTHGRSPPGKA